MKDNNWKGEALKGLLGQNIRRYRGLAALSQEGLARKAGISLPFLGALERGEKWPSPATLAGLAYGLDVTPYDLIKPENTASVEITKITGKLVKEINAAVSASVKAINAAVKE